MIPSTAPSTSNYARDTIDEDYPIFMCSISKIGFDLTTKTAPVIYKKDEHGNLLNDKAGKPIVDTEVPEAVEAFRQFRRQHDIRYRDNEDF